MTYDGSDLIEKLEHQYRTFSEQFAHVPVEFAGSAFGCGRLTRLLRDEIGARPLGDGWAGYQEVFTIFGIPIVEDESVPEDEIRIRYRSGEEKMFKLPGRFAPPRPPG